MTRPSAVTIVVTLLGQAVLADVGVDARLERLEVLLLGLGRARRPPCASAALPAPSAVTAGSVVGGVAATLGEVVGAAALLQSAAAGQDAPGERVLQRALQRHELRLVHRGDREEDHEQRHQQRDHVRVGEQPALVALLGLLLARPCACGRWRAMATRPPRRRRPRRHRRGAGSACASSAEPRSAGGTRLISFSETTRGLSPAWIERMPSRTRLRACDLLVREALQAVGDGQEDDVGRAHAV